MRAAGMPERVRTEIRTIPDVAAFEIGTGITLVPSVVVFNDGSHIVLAAAGVLSDADRKIALRSLREERRPAAGPIAWYGKGLTLLRRQ
jgi:hypothetical protein